MTPPPLRVVFAGTPEFAAVALDALLQQGFVVPLVLTQPDRPAGRGMKLQASPVKQLALQHGMAVAQPRSLRLDGRFPQEASEAQALLAQARADVMVVAAYGLILPPWVLETPRLGCLNIHASLLPRWRGAAPIHRAIEAGDRLTGVTIMQMDAGLDTGDMLLHDSLVIDPQATSGSLHDQLASLGGRLIVQALQQAVAGQLQPVRQPDDGVTYAHKIDKAEALLDWAAPAALLARRIRAFNPFPGASTLLDGQPLKIWHAEAVSDCSQNMSKLSNTDNAFGQIFSISPAGIDVRTGQGTLRLLELQRAGGKRLRAEDFLRGHPLQVGQQLG